MKLRLFADGIVLAAGLLIAAGCGGSQAAEPATPPPAEGEPAAPEGAPTEAGASKKFDDLAPAEKLKFMKEVVMPTMKAKFQAFNAEHYAEFSCVTCHGPGAKDGNFEMPTAALPKLPEDMKPLMAEKPDVMKFMVETVKPEMKQLLGEGDDFGCFDCHTKG